MIRRLILGTGAAALLLGAGATAWTVTGPGATDFAGDDRVVLDRYAGADPTGVPAALRGADKVARGEYLTHAADCVVCHTRPGGRPFAGGRAFRTPLGTIYSTNITADRETGTGRHSDDQWLAAVKRGKRHDGARLYPAMPFASYALMSDADALAIKRYIHSLPPVTAPARANALPFPFNQRRLIALWAAAFVPGRSFEPHAKRSPEWNRGAYLTEALGHCAECHTPRNIGYGLDTRHKFAGAVQAGWNAHNISGDRRSGIGGWSDAALARYLSAGQADGHGVASGPMGEVVDHSLRHLTPADIRAMVTYLRTVPAQDSGAPTRVVTAAPAVPAAGRGADRLGEAVFAGSCAGCHSWTGGSAVARAAVLTGTRSINDPGGTNVAQAVIEGVHREQPGLLFMPAFACTLDDREIAAVTNYITRRLSAASRLSAGDVADLRRSTDRPATCRGKW